MTTFLVVTKNGRFFLIEGRGLPDAIKRGGFYPDRVFKTILKILPCR